MIGKIIKLVRSARVRPEMRDHRCPHLPGIEIRIVANHSDIYRGTCEDLRLSAVYGAHKVYAMATEGPNWISLLRPQMPSHAKNSSFFDVQVRPLIGMATNEVTGEEGDV